MSFLRDRVIRAARIRFGAAFLAAYLFEGCALFLYYNDGITVKSLLGVIILHILSALSFLAVKAKRRSLPGIGYYYPRMAALCSLFLPVIGLCGISLTFFALNFMKSQGLAKEYKEKPFENEAVDVELPADITGFLFDEIDIHPIADILAGDDIGMKRGAVNLLRRIGSSEAVSLLRKSLSDSNSEVRFYAHTALTRLEEDYVNLIEDARFRAERFGKAKNHAELAFAYGNYSGSGLPEVNMQTYYLDLSRQEWEKALEKDPGNLDYRLKLAAVCVDGGKFSQAVDLYRETIQVEGAELESRLGICRAYFEKGDFSSLFAEVDEMRSRPVPEDENPFNKLVYNFWMNKGAANGQ